MVIKRELHMNIKLIAADINLYKAWRFEFSNLNNIEIIHDDIFKQTADAIVSPANSFGIMDGGLDGKLRDFFGMQIEESVRAKTKTDYSGELPVGSAIVVGINNSQFKFLISAPTMRVPEEAADSLNAYLAMRAIFIAAVNHKDINLIAVPGLCSLSGRMPMNIVARQLRVAYERVVLDRIQYSNWREERDLQGYLRCMANTLPFDLERKY